MFPRRNEAASIDECGMGPLFGLPSENVGPPALMFNLGRIRISFNYLFYYEASRPQILLHLVRSIEVEVQRNSITPHVCQMNFGFLAKVECHQEESPRTQNAPNLAQDLRQI